MPEPIIPKPLPSVEYLRQCFRYSPETGVLTWRARPRGHFNTDLAHHCFLSGFAGRPTGSVNRRGYLVVRLNGGSFQAHRIAWAVHFGSWPNQQVDHVNLIKHDNRISNLREVDNATNSLGRVRSKANTSGSTGVYWRPELGKWVAMIRVAGKLHYLGIFADKGAATSARKDANLRFGFSDAHGQLSQCHACLINPGRLRKNNSSGHVGVSPVQSRWRARVSVKGVVRHLGVFKTIEEAIAARKAAEIQYGVADRIISGSGPAILQDPPT